jgi:hypothetical protein
MSKNYEEAARLATFEPNEWNAPAFAQANVLATLALVDEMRAARAPELEGVYVICQYDNESGEFGQPVEVLRDRVTAYARRDEWNDSAIREGVKHRHIVKEMMLL